MPNEVLAFAPTDDAYIRADRPSSNSGRRSTLQIDATPLKHVLLKFSPSGIGARPVISAKLRLYTVNPSSLGGEFRPADSNWSEQTVTWDNAPPAGDTVLASLGPVATDNWYEVDVTPLVAGDGTLSLRITPTSSDGATYSSKEGTTGFAPQLVVIVPSAP